MHPDEGREGWLHAFGGDVRIAIRSLRRAPAVVLAAVCSIAIGIGATTTVFAAIDAMLLRPVPLIEGVYGISVLEEGVERSATTAELRAWEDADARLELAAYDVQGMNLGGDVAERLTVARVTPEFFAVLRTSPAIGAGLVRARARAGADAGAGADATAGAGAESDAAATAGVGASGIDSRRIVLSHGLWRERFGGDRSLLGRAILLEGDPYTVAGVMPPRTDFPSSAIDAWIPHPMRVAGDDSRVISVIARLEPGASLADAQRALDLAQHAVTGVVGGAMGTSSSAAAAGGASAGVVSPSGGRITIRLATVHERLLTPRLRQAAWIGVASVALVLLIACANVANLLLARGAGRWRELAIRRALGGSRGRIARQLLVESVVIALLGGGLGVLLAGWGVDGLIAMWNAVPDTRPFPEDASLHARPLAVALLVTLGAALLVGLLPALEGSRADPRAALADGGRGASAGARSRRIQRVFVVAQIAVSLVLLVSAALLTRSFLHLQVAELGFEPTDATSFRVSLPADLPSESRRGIIAAIEERVSAIPGVQAVGAAASLPLEGAGERRPFRLPGQDAGAAPRGVPFRVITPAYHAALGIPIVRGRALAESDRDRARVVINESVARRHWPEQSPLGESIVLGEVPYEIVGVAADTREWGPHAEGPPIVYALTGSGTRASSAAPASAPGSSVASATGVEQGESIAFVARSRLDAAVLAPAVRAAVREAHPDAAVHELQAMSESMRENTARSLLMSRLMSIFAAIAVLLAVVGVYGAVAYSVEQRTTEMGIRRALGATAGGVASLILRQGMRLALVGVVLGTLLSLGWARLLARFLAGVGPADPIAIAGSAALLTLAAVIACLTPARRASRVEPMEALRGE